MSMDMLRLEKMPSSMPKTANNYHKLTKGLYKKFVLSETHDQNTMCDTRQVNLSATSDLKST